jgi:predicted DNA-binding transcriptional regulator AlpA
MEKIQFIEVTPEQLQQQITTGVKEQLNEFLKYYTPKQPQVYVTRREVATLFDVDISTIHNWCKSGRLKPLGLGSRVYFLRSEIDDCLTPLNS